MQGQIPPPAAEGQGEGRRGGQGQEQTGGGGGGGGYGQAGTQRQGPPIMILGHSFQAAAPAIAEKEEGQGIGFDRIFFIVVVRKY